jgi:hypothetical protein
LFFCLVFFYRRHFFYFFLSFIFFIFFHSCRSRAAARHRCRGAITRRLRSGRACLCLGDRARPGLKKREIYIYYIYIYIYIYIYMYIYRRCLVFLPPSPHPAHIYIHIIYRHISNM